MIFLGLCYVHVHVISLYTAQSHYPPPPPFTAMCLPLVYHSLPAQQG